MEQAQQPPEVVLTAEAARIVGVSPQRIRALADQGDLPVYLIAEPCGTRIFDRAQVVAFAAKRRDRRG